MEIKKITWEDKVAIEDLSDIEEINKVTAANINEIKDVVNSNGDFTIDEINKLQTSINETNTNVETANNGITANASGIANLEQKHTQQQNAIDTNTANISSLNTSVADIRNNINDINTSLNETNQKVNEKQDIITAGDGIQLLNNLISIQEQLLNKWNGYQTLIQTNQGDIAANTNEISTLQNDVNGISNLIQQIIEGLKQFPVFEIVGEWVSGTAYRKNQAVYHNNKLWNSKINNNRTEPSESNTDWFLISKFDVNLSNYVTQNDLNNALRLKQDVLTGVNGITISQQTNEISIDNNLLTKWNGYENLIQANQTNISSIQNKADANEAEINRVNGIVVTNQTNITDLQNKTNTIEQNYVSKTTTTPQSIASQITFTQTDMVLKFNSGTNNSAYLAGFKSNNQRVWYFGKGSSTSDNFVIGADRGVIKLEPSTHVDVSNKRIINVATPTAINDATNKQYVDNNTLSKTSTTSQTVAGPVSFTQPITAATPTVDTHAATKAYVDNAIQNITPGNGGSIPQQTLDQINNNTNNIVDLGNRTTTLENNYLNKTASAAQTIAGPVSFTQAITIPTPTQNNQAANKQYVDTAIANNGGSGGSIDTSNFATLNTAQTITGAKTFTNNVVISKNPTPLILKANNNDKTYMLIKSSDDTTNFSLGANSSNTSLEVNRGDLTINTQQANKNVNFTNVAKVKFNRSVLEMGTEINAGFGGGSVKFIPEDNSTKTLQFYNNQPSDARRFKLLVPDPTEAQNPATKAYVDTAIQNINPGSGGNIPQQTLDQINTNKTNITALQGQVNTNTNNINSNYTNLNTLINRTNTIERNYLRKNETNIEQVIEGPITFRQRVSVPTTPRSASDVTNKTYVDDLISQIPKGGYDVIFSNSNTFNNLNALSPINISSNTTSNKPFIIQFDRMGNNGNKYEGTIYYNFLLPEINQATFAGNSFWYNSTNKRFEAGANAGITILRTNANTLQLTIQCWDNGNRISKIKLFAPR